MVDIRGCAGRGNPQHAEPAYAGPPPARSGRHGRPLGQLKELGERRAAGVLTDAELEAQTATILAG
ncbi:hypothetical protein [Miltoncostaea marina]|uniref:hypothetical protein n=1 Tax=Miltoncostaea marina TaxID=2843215 RepID=UPI001C3CB510|nr:hypothetical protein [Miltoncostaea marina]